MPTFKKLAAQLISPKLNREEVKIFMFLAHPTSDDTESDHSSPPDDVEAPAGPDNSTFRANWPYVTTMKHYLNASSYENVGNLQHVAQNSRLTSSSTIKRLIQAA